MKNSTLKMQILGIALLLSGIGMISASETVGITEAVNVVQAQDINDEEIGLMEEVTCQCSSSINPFGNTDCTANNWGSTCHTGTELCYLGSSNCCSIGGCDEPEDDPQ